MKMRAIVVMLALVALLAVGLGAQQGRDSQAQAVAVRAPLQANDALTVVGQVGGSVTAVAAKDGLAITGVGTRLLVFDVTEGWEPLCKFLGVQVPDGSFPRVNDTAQVLVDREESMKTD